jgi:hypothetical protein
MQVLHASAGTMYMAGKSEFLEQGCLPSNRVTPTAYRLQHWGAPGRDTLQRPLTEVGRLALTYSWFLQ